MKTPIIKPGSLILVLFLLVIACNQELVTTPAKTKRAHSYAHIDFSKATPVITNPSGSSSIESIELDPIKTTYDDEQKAHQLALGDSIPIKIKSFAPTMVQVMIKAPAGPTDGEFWVVAGGDFQLKFVGKLSVNKIYKSGKETYKYGVIQIDRSYMTSGTNLVTVASVNNSAFTDIIFLARDLYAKDNVLSTTIYSQFAGTDQVTGALLDSIWTRAYGLGKGIDMIPGPTLHFEPGDLLEIEIVNKLNPDSFPPLQSFDDIHATSMMVDEELANVQLHGEINIPHNLNNTNLHVHGLHVDPSKDDVTTVIVPAGAKTDHYDAPDTDQPVTKISDLDRFSVADQSVKAGSWKYVYRIPSDHLPGTHWFHPHKHGATAAQVENGMAGTIVIEENSTNAIVPYPGTSTADLKNYNNWKKKHDRVFAIQEITNYGINFGEGNRGGEKSIARAKNLSKKDKAQLDLTVNGKSDLTIKFDLGQLERWRLVNAGTNHRSFAHVWLGKHIGTTDKDSIYQQVPIHLVAVDGITLPDTVRVTAEHPALLAPGNRSDFLVQLEENGTYVLFKNYGVPGIVIKKKDGTVLFDWKTRKKSTFWPYVASNKHNPYLFEPNSDTSTLNYLGYTKKWMAKLKRKGYPNGKDTVSTPNIVPNIKARQLPGKALLDVDFATVKDSLVGSISQWKPLAFGVAVPAGHLLTAKVDGPNTGSFIPQFPSKNHMEAISPASPNSNTPAYVAPIPKENVLQSRPVVFDVSGLGIALKNKKGGHASINQFTLNGRFFELNDPVGNPAALSLVEKPYQSPLDLADSSHGDPAALKKEKINLAFNGTAGTGYTERNKIGKNWYFMNPGYYMPITFKDTLGMKVHYYDTTQTESTPTWKKLTGIESVAIYNENSTFNTNSADKDPGLPRATSPEEWLLINNSDVSHPFHIHINPFYVVETGQLAYMKHPNSDSFDWYMKSVVAPNEKLERKTWEEAQPGDIIESSMDVPGIVGNFWDTIIIPAHGYVRVRYWFNVPQQTPDNAIVNDNVDRTGIWVYHCHILRHEDRGMMMPIITQPMNYIPAPMENK